MWFCHRSMNSQSVTSAAIAGSYLDYKDLLLYAANSGNALDFIDPALLEVEPGNCSVLSISGGASILGSLCNNLVAYICRRPNTRKYKYTLPIRHFVSSLTLPVNIYLQNNSLVYFKHISC